MGEKKIGRLNQVIILALLLGLFLSACGGETPAVNPVDVTETQAAATAAPTDTPQPTPTLAPARVVLVTAGMDEVMHADLLAALNELSSSDSLTVEEAPELTSGMVQPDWRTVIAYNAGDALNEAVAANPAVQFIVYSDQELAPAANLNVIRVRRDKQAFLAGYVSTVITYDWRVGGLFSPDPAGDQEEQAFINGGEYLCGLCNPYYAPLVLFPISARVSSTADTATWQTEVDTLLGNILYTVYVSPASQSPALLEALAQRGVTLVGTGTAPENIKDRWAASVVLDYTTPLREMWPTVLAGQGGQALETSIALAYINEEVVTVGKQRLIENVIQELDGGWLDPMDPAE